MGVFKASQVFMNVYL